MTAADRLREMVQLRASGHRPWFVKTEVGWRLNSPWSLAPDLAAWSADIAGELTHLELHGGCGDGTCWACHYLARLDRILEEQP